MNIQKLATHIAELPAWVALVLHTDELDFATAPYEPSTIDNTADLLNFFERSVADETASLSQATEKQHEPI